MKAKTPTAGLVTNMQASNVHFFDVKPHFDKHIQITNGGGRMLSKSIIARKSRVIQSNTE